MSITQSAKNLDKIFKLRATFKINVGDVIHRDTQSDLCNHAIIFSFPLRNRFDIFRQLKLIRSQLYNYKIMNIKSNNSVKNVYSEFAI